MEKVQRKVPKKERKRWMEACLDEELPPTTELEEGLRNGVYLAKLGHFFAPQTVSLKKIYDREQARYTATGLHFRHTDNVIQWLNAMSAKGLPKIFYPETTDIYDRKNMPRCIYCIHALSLYLFKLGLAPQIQDLYGKVDFTEEEINNMKSELEKYGIQMPAFSKIGGILANELSVDEAALHAAVIAINEAVDAGDPQGTFVALQNPNAMLLKLEPDCADAYQATLSQAKDRKVQSSKTRMENPDAERDVYDELLTQAEIQGNVNQVNTSTYLRGVEAALLAGDEDQLLEALRALGLKHLEPNNKSWYLKQLQGDREAKEQVSPGKALTKDELQNGVNAANEFSDGYNKMLAAVARINTAIKEGVAAQTVEELMNPDAQLPTVFPEAAELYQRELSSLQQQSPEGALSHPELMVAVEMLSAVVLMNSALDRGDKAALWNLLSSLETGLSNVDPESAQRYMEELLRLKAEAGSDFLTWNDIQACIDQVNQTVSDEHLRIAAIGQINEALDEGNANRTLESLQNPSAKLENVDPDLAVHYHDVLQGARREKAHGSRCCSRISTQGSRCCSRISTQGSRCCSRISTQGSRCCSRISTQGSRCCSRISTQGSRCCSRISTQGSRCCSRISTQGSRCCSRISTQGSRCCSRISTQGSRCCSRISTQGSRCCSRISTQGSRCCSRISTQGSRCCSRISTQGSRCCSRISTQGSRCCSRISTQGSRCCSRISTQGSRCCSRISTQGSRCCSRIITQGSRCCSRIITQGSRCCSRISTQGSRCCSRISTQGSRCCSRIITQGSRQLLFISLSTSPQETQDPSAVLWLDEIQEAVLRANQNTADALLFSQCIQNINRAVDQGDPGPTLSALKQPGAGLYGVTSECAEEYQRSLKEAKEGRGGGGEGGGGEGGGGEGGEGGDGSEWVQHWVKGGHHYFYNLVSGHGTWVEPEGFTPNTCELSKDDIQGCVSGVTSAYNREQLWVANEALIARLQAHCRGFLVRRGLKERKAFMESQEPAVTTIQAHWKGYKQRKNYKDRKQYLKEHGDQAVKIQSLVRMQQARKKYKDRLKYFKDHIDDVVKIQAFIRANKARDDYKTLINAGDPPMAVVRKFVHLLDQSDQDFQEELELMMLREEVVTNIRSNQSLEKDLNVMDIKIGLLVKNKITLQDVVSHSKRLTKKNHNRLSTMMLQTGTRGGLKALSKDKRAKLEAYQHLFYLLQTNPTYLAKLIFQMPQNKSTKFMDSVIFTLYNYASNQREEYLLLRLFKTALQEEIKSKVDQLKEVVTGNPTVIKMVVSFHRGARGQNALRQILAPVVKETIDDKTLNIKTDPVDIYKSWVNHMETQTGEASNLPYDVTPEQAMSHEEVRTRLETSLKNMKNLTDKFLSAITSSVDKIPYGMRFISKILKDSLQEKFPDATEDELLKIVGNLLYYRYMNPAVVAPDAFDILEVPGGGLTTEQRRNLGSVAKMLQHAAASKLFYGDNGHLTPINEYLSNAYSKYRRFFLAACDVPSLEEKFNVDQYSDLVTVNKPVIYISIGEVVNTHTLLLDHADAIAPEQNDPLHELLEDLGEVPTVETLLGEKPLSPEDPARDLLSKTEVSLTLTNKFDLSAEESSERDAKTVLLNTKRLIVDVIRFQPGETLTEILDATASPEQEAEYQRAMQRRAQRDARTQTQSRPDMDLDLDSLSLQGKKDKIRHNLQLLSEMGRVSPQDRYQGLINDIAKDIRDQRRYRQRRKAELVRLQQTNAALNQKTKFYHVQIDQYEQYIRTCMDNLTQGRASNTKAKKSKQVSHKYTASRLHEKGVLISVEDLQPNQFKNVIFEICRSEKVGVFDVKAKLLGVHLETVQLEYQDLLQLQYEGVALMKLFDRATINVNLLIFLLNKKFYGK
uniref:IQ motif containing GTPase activating protein 1 n=1 Tax=Knipowitschia caucasica TaxID=637954 RepID=A0AAV2LS01_KNICA